MHTIFFDSDSNMRLHREFKRYGRFDKRHSQERILLQLEGAVREGGILSLQAALLWIQLGNAVAHF